MKPEVTGVVIIHNDASLLQHALSSARPLIDRLLIVDGAYRWAAPFCSLSGEDPERSTDKLLEVVESTGLPYEYYSGIWESESAKRVFSLEKARTDFVMRIDSDEIYDIDTDVLASFFDSKKPIGECYCPLYFSADVIGISRVTTLPPRVPIFINKSAGVTIRQIVDSMFLLVPPDERLERLSNASRFPQDIGIVHHLSLFRGNDSGYRRARFYNLLSMRVAKKLSLVKNVPFSTDAEFFELLGALGGETKEAMNSMFRFHRIAAAFPQLKDNQALKHFTSHRKDIRDLVGMCFEEMLDEQRRLLKGHFSRRWRIFSNRPLFIDVTRAVKDSELKIAVHASYSNRISVIENIQRDLVREKRDVDVENSMQGKWQFHVARLPPNASRCVLEISVHSDKDIVDFELEEIGH